MWLVAHDATCVRMKSAVPARAVGDRALLVDSKVLPRPQVQCQDGEVTALMGIPEAPAISMAQDRQTLTPFSRSLRSSVHRWDNVFAETPG